MLLISEELAQKVINYLVEKPFKEVAGILNDMSRLQPQPPNPTSAPKQEPELNNPNIKKK